MPSPNKLLIFPGSGSRKLTAAICKYLRVKPGKCTAMHYAEGNTFVRVGENVRGRDVFFVQSLSYPVNDHLMETLFYIDAFKRASANSVTAVIPFFSYGKGDKKDEPRVSIRAHVRCSTASFPAWSSWTGSWTSGRCSSTRPGWWCGVMPGSTSATSGSARC